MKRSQIPIFLAGILLSSFAIGFAQRSDEPRGSIKLVGGYTHQRLQGIDTRVGKIAQKRGLVISYDIGRLAGNHAAKNKDGAAWFKEQTVNGQSLQLAFTKDKKIYATFAGDTANFYATARTDEDLADFLLMVLTYPSEPNPK